ncbi:GNAT family N-acetyltransferase [Oscillospiraceae bacterium MB08-C2-2]|nr:GNAT family N-acetyltransferase [Oscillospiraceae bacterium MB08-C2-2]
MQVSIEKYQDKDFKEVISLLVSSFKSKFLHRQSLNESEIESILYSTWDIQAEDPGYLHFVAKVNEKIVGVILIRYGPIPKNRKKVPIFNLIRQYGLLNMLLLLFKLSILEIFNFQECYIEHIAVDKSMRGKGIGEQLISYCEELLIKMSYSTLTLAVAADNSAKHLYSRMGFQEIKHNNHCSKKFFIGINQWIFMKKLLI